KTGARLAAVLEASSDGTGPAASPVVTIDTDAAAEVGRAQLPGVSQLSEASGGRIIAGTDGGVAFIDPDTGKVSRTLDVNGKVRGLVAISDIQDDPIYASVLTASGPRVSAIIAASGKDPRVDQTFTLPGSTAGRAYFDLASRMVHVEGTVAEHHEGAG